MSNFVKGDLIKSNVETSQLRLGHVYEVSATEDGLLFIPVVALGLPTHRGADPVGRFPLDGHEDKFKLVEGVE